MADQKHRTSPAIQSSVVWTAAIAERFGFGQVPCVECVTPNDGMNM